MSRRIKTAGFLAADFFVALLLAAGFFTAAFAFAGLIGVLPFLAACFLTADFLGDLLVSRLLGYLLLGHLSGRLTEMKASRCTSAFGLLQAGVLHSSAEGQLSRELTALSSTPTEKFLMTYFNMSWRDKPPLSVKLEMASLTISLYFW